MRLFGEWICAFVANQIAARRILCVILAPAISVNESKIGMSLHQQPKKGDEKKTKTNSRKIDYTISQQRGRIASPESQRNHDTQNEGR